ncbi:hypothetical protein G6539_30520 [Streptomyces albidoflavus]|nr:hypothetical protein [Streptomyces albidoflavus]
MSSTPASPHGFATVRGRGYRPAQADQYVAALERERDEAHAEAERLTALAEGLGAEAATLAETVATLPEPTYDNLGERAQRLYALVQEQSEALDAAGRAEAEEAVRRTDQEAQTQAAELLQQAQATADRVAAEAERLVRDHEEQREALRARMEHIRTALAALTGRGVVGVPAAPEAEEAPEVSGAPVALPAARREQPGGGAEPDVA